MTPELRQKMGETAVLAVKAAGYDNIGTVEFLVDKDLNYYFLEVNARIQVEHPVTEMTTGIDLVKLQVEISEGKPIEIKQEEIFQMGHATECRIYAEDPYSSFMPSPGTIFYMKEPTGPGVRYDSGIKQGMDVSIFYDPILAKLITFGKTRNESITRMVNTLKENVILGVQTSIPFMLDVLQHPKYIAGELNTNFLNQEFPEYTHSIEDSKIPLALTGLIQTKHELKSGLINQVQDTNPFLEIGSWELF